MATLQVLCPNGRRQNVKITPNTKLLQVLEDVCQKQKFLPPEDYKLIHGRTTLDLTLSVRYANLPNNAKLELVKAEKSRAETEVLIALQLENGERLQHSFSPGTSLWELLLHWENQQESALKDKFTKVDSTQSPALHPVCIYMREEVAGELALRETKLRTLGLTGGKAALRLLHRPVDEKTLADIANKIEKEKLRKAKLEQTASKQKSPMPSSSNSTTETSVQSSMSVESQGNVVNESSAQIKTDNAAISLNINVNIQNDNTATTTERTTPKAEPGEPSPKVVRLEEEPVVSHDSCEPMEVEQPQTGENVMETEDAVSSSIEVEKAPQAQRQSDPAGSGQSAVDRLRGIPGIEVYTPDDFNDLPPEQQQVARRLAQSFLANMGAQGFNVNQQLPPGAAAQKKPKKPRQQAAPFADFKFPEATKGQNLYNNEMSCVRKEEFQPCDRKTKVFNVEESVSVKEPSGQDDDLPDEFFELTDRDMRSLIAAQQKRLQEIEDQPLMTSTMRKAKLEAEYSRYDRVVIRVQFHDKLTLQGLFRPRETIFAVKKFVKEHLEDKSMPFYLYTAPPKNVLKDDTQDLIEARLVPATVVYFGSEQQKDHYLSEAVLSELSPKLQADILVAECLNELNEQKESSSSSVQSSSAKGKKPANYNPSSSSSSSASAQNSDKSVPKWFKVGKK
ncbi:tether containing UBX domain for GLUT4-like [Mercenaria mercenaria]|uniref:tether containing UBX domain for GLUT4-like n=1 Tax=Mercenaria mercenaria TaxID=6596 RepID=UPI00234F1D7E|nr:tether containing UBX domain for GLUT4-like [Mercenaria mercenaria]